MNLREVLIRRVGFKLCDVRLLLGEKGKATRGEKERGQPQPNEEIFGERDGKFLYLKLPCFDKGHSFPPNYVIATLFFGQSVGFGSAPLPFTYFLFSQFFRGIAELSQPKGQRGLYDDTQLPMNIYHGSKQSLQFLGCKFADTSISTNIFGKKNLVVLRNVTNSHGIK